MYVLHTAFRFQRCVVSFWFAVSVDIFKQCRDRVLEAVIPDPQCGALGALIISGMMAAHPELSLDVCLPPILRKIVFVKRANGGHEQLGDAAMRLYQPQSLELRGSKEVLYYYLGLLEGAIVAAHGLVIPYIPVLCSTITFVHSLKSSENLKMLENV